MVPLMDLVLLGYQHVFCHIPSLLLTVSLPTYLMSRDVLFQNLGFLLNYASSLLALPYV
jgi:hypothetical protein